MYHIFAKIYVKTSIWWPLKNYGSHTTLKLRPFMLLQKIFEKYQNFNINTPYAISSANTITPTTKKLSRFLAGENKQ